MKRFIMSAAAIVFLGACALVSGPQQPARAHCQVPCGIYDDAARISAMLEDATTIEKATRSIQDLGGSHDVQSINQVTRWVITKEDHATHIIETVSAYFLTQKVKEVAPGAPAYPDYLNSLAVHHRVLRAAMKTKQSVDPANVKTLRESIEALGQLYKK